MNNNPIGVFDSGVGGFTVVKEIFNKLPYEEIIYFGDTARSPYGVRTDREILDFSRQIVEFLISKKAKLIVIACNTATIASIDVLQKEFDIPIIGVVEPGVEAALLETKNNKVGLIGTDFTINSKKYENIIKSKRKEVEVFGKGCPILVTLAENGSFNDESSYQEVKECLKDVLEYDIDTLILGCTHFPLLINNIRKSLPDKIIIVDPAIKTAEETKKVLNDNDMLRNNMGKPKHTFICSGDIEKYTEVYNIVFDEKNEILRKELS